MQTFLELWDKISMEREIGWPFLIFGMLRYIKSNLFNINRTQVVTTERAGTKYFCADRNVISSGAVGA